MTDGLVSVAAGALPYHVDRLVAHMDEQDADMVIASTAQNLRYFTGFAPVVKTLNPHLGECYAIISRDNTASVSVVHSAGEADQILDMTAPLATAWIYGTFHRNIPSRTTSLLDEIRLQSFGKPVADTARQALIMAVQATVAQKTNARVLIDDDGMRPETLLALQIAYPNMTFVDASMTLRRIRHVKTMGEIALLTQAARQNEAAVATCLAHACAGQSETEIVAQFEQSVLAQGGRPGVTMMKIGRHAVTGQRRPNAAHRLATGDLLWFDSDTVHQNYWSDIARTAVFGSPTPRQIDRYDALRAGMAEGLTALRPGQTGADVFAAVMHVVRNAGIPEYARHHVGHGIGLEPFEGPVLAPNDTTVLEAGMVISLETPFYEYGFGALHIEDPVCITQNGAEFLTLNPNPHLASFKEIDA